MNEGYLKIKYYHLLVPLYRINNFIHHLCKGIEIITNLLAVANKFVLYSSLWRVDNIYGSFSNFG